MKPVPVFFKSKDYILKLHKKQEISLKKTYCFVVIYHILFGF